MMESCRAVVCDLAATKERASEGIKAIKKREAERCVCAVCSIRRLSVSSLFVHNTTQSTRQEAEADVTSKSVFFGEGG